MTGCALRRCSGWSGADVAGPAPRALVIGASGGIGAALVRALMGDGWHVTGLSRSQGGFDITDEAAVIAGLAPLSPGFDRLIVATGALALSGTAPEKTLRNLNPLAMAAQFATNAIGPALVLKHGLRLVRRDQPALIAALSARVGSIGDNGLGGWYSYRAAKAALNQLIHTAAIEIARSHPAAAVVALHPGTVETPLTHGYRGSHPALSPDQAATHLMAVMADLTAAETGGFFDWQGTRVPW